MAAEIPGELHAPAEKRVDVGTWGVFFAWVGVVLLAKLGWGVWLVGVGAILVGAQLIRRLLGLPIEWFWIGAGALCALGGTTELSPFGLDIAIIPVISIAAGVGLLAKALIQRARPGHA